MPHCGIVPAILCVSYFIPPERKGPVSDKVAIKNLQRVIQLCYQMLELADRGDKNRQDDGCGIVFGLLRDAAYKIRRQAEKELEVHQKNP